MRCAAVLLLALAVPCLGQTGAITKNNTSGPCSPITPGNNNNYTINCKIGPQRGKQMLALLNKILANQIDPKAVMEKLDEILKNINPNLPAKTYFCSGQWRTMGPGANAAMEVEMGGDDTDFQREIVLVNHQQYDTLLDDCLAQMKAKPEWLTPYLTCGVAYLGLGDKANAAAMLKDFDSKTGPAYDVNGCKQMADYLRAHLSQ